MPYLAIAGIVASLVSTGVGAYNASQAGKSPPQVKTTQLSLPNFGGSLDQYLSQQGKLGPLQDMLNQENKLSNTGWQDQLSSLDPNLMRSVSQLGQNTLSDLQGQLPQDVQTQIQNDTAFQALQGGFAGTGMARNLTARDLGLTSLNLQNTGAQNLSTDLSDLTALNPANASLSSLLFSPQQLLQRSDNQALYNTDLENQAAFANAGAQYSGSAAQNAAITGFGNQTSSQITQLLSNKNLQNSFATLFGGSGAGTPVTGTGQAFDSLSAPAAGGSNVSSGMFPVTGTGQAFDSLNTVPGSSGVNVASTSTLDNLTSLFG